MVRVKLFWLFPGVIMLIAIMSITSCGVYSFTGASIPP